MCACCLSRGTTQRLIMKGKGLTIFSRILEIDSVSCFIGDAIPLQILASATIVIDPFSVEPFSTRFKLLNNVIKAAHFSCWSSCFMLCEECKRRIFEKDNARPTCSLKRHCIWIYMYYFTNWLTLSTVWKYLILVVYVLIDNKEVITVKKDMARYIHLFGKYTSCRKAMTVPTRLKRLLQQVGWI